MAHRVLVVDGEIEGLSRIQAHLQPHGYAFTWALTVTEALQNIARDPPDVVIVDGSLSNGSGIELVGELRRGDLSRHIPVIFGLDKGDEEQRVWARRAGTDEIFEKPFDGQALSIAVRQLIRVKAARQELAIRNRELAAIYEGQRAFIEAMVHDFKNPIAVVHVNLAWLADHIVDKPDLVEALSDAQEGIERLQKMIDDLLMVGMLEQSSLPIKREFIRVTELLDQAIKSHQKEAIARNVSLQVAFREKNVGVVGDAALLRRVVNNMVEASLRHTPSSGKIQLTARAGDSVEIEISNTGRPLDAEEKAQLLDRSPPSSGSGTHHIANGGLGLYFCKRAVEAHDGEVDIVESDEWPTSLILRLPTTGT